MEQCLCGCSKYMEIEKTYFQVTPAGKTVTAPDTLPFAQCLDCGIIRQMVNGHFFDYTKYQPTTTTYKAKTYQHDRKLASLRAERYGITPETCRHKTVLDVGCGSGAFVDECRERGVVAYGCEIAKYSYVKNTDFIYFDRLEDIHFPTDKFSIVTCHDVLEHIKHPKGFIDELFRINEEFGTCIVDFPDFYSNAGAHHWKQEHIWCFSLNQLEDILENAGFKIINVDKPIESKIVITCKKPKQNRPAILLPPGIGDSWWSLIKLQSFLKREGLSLPEIRLACPREKKYNGHERAFPFLETFPFIKASWDVCDTHTHKKDLELWKEAYAIKGRTIFPGVLGCDYFISYNGHLRFGAHLEEVDPDLECNWGLPMFVSLEQKKYREECVKKYGRYIVFYFVFQGTYSKWLAEFELKKIVEYIQKLCKKTKCTPVFCGAKWDAEEPNFIKLKSHLPEAINLNGKTTVDEVFGLMKGAQLVVGFPSGLTILSAAIRAKTLIIWNDYYDRDFAWNCCPPETRNKNYFVENTKNLTVDTLLEVSVSAIGEEKVNSRPLVGSPKEPNPARRHQKTLPTTIKKEAKQCLRPLRVHNGKRPVRIPRNDLIIACVLKSGGIYNEEYACILKNMVNRNLSTPHQFVILSDVPIDTDGVLCLEYDLPGWWSKLELFRITDCPVLYFDLDTVLLSDISNMANGVKNMKPGEFKMLSPFNPLRRKRGEWASGVMAFHGDFSYLLQERPSHESKELQNGWDQVYIYRKLTAHGMSITSINEMGQIYSYKRNCLASRKPPKNSQVICFHGKHRPHTVDDEWVKEAWR